MNRTNYALMSLTAAVPGALLVLVLVTGFLQHAGDMPGMLAAIAGLTLLVAALLAATPVGILLFGGPRAAASGASGGNAAVADKPTGAKKEKKRSLEPEDESFVTDDELGEDVASADDDWNEGDSAVDFSESEVMEAGGDEFEFEDDASSEADFDLDDERKR